MPASSDAALSLAGHLRSLDDAALIELLSTREIRESSIKDFFDLADALLDPDSLQRALAHLDRPTLATLAGLARLGTTDREDTPAALTALGIDTAPFDAHVDQLVRRALILVAGATLVVPDAVTRQLDSWPALGLPTLEQLVGDAAPTALAPVGHVETRFTDTVAAERAFGTTSAVAQLVAELGHEPARELARGGVALPDSKRLAMSMSVELDAVPSLLEIASRAGLVALDATGWMPATDSAAWLQRSSADRWATLAGAWLDGLPTDIRAILASSAHASWGERLDEFTDWLYPAGGDWMRERVLDYTRYGELLGITAAAEPSTPGVALLTLGAQPAAAAMLELFPPAVEQVYLQHDLSIVSPGPLAPQLDERLRSMTIVEGRALASTYRVSTASLNRAMAAGETASTIRSFLAGISLTGIPQPLEYLITEAAARYGLVRVGSVDGDRAYVSSTDATLLRTLLVDHSLTALGLTRAGDRLISRFDRDLVFWSLAEARYPVAAEDADGSIVVLERRRAGRPTAAPASGTAAALIERLRLGSSSDEEVTGQAWLARQLDVAIRGKLALTVTVQLQDGSTVDLQLEPASIGGGRMRARDRKADLERTLPLSSIVAVGPAL